QLRDVDALGDLVLDRKRIGACVADIAGKTRIDIVEDDNAEPHSITAPVRARRDAPDRGIMGDPCRNSFAVMPRLTGPKAAGPEGRSIHRPGCGSGSHAPTSPR